MIHISRCFLTLFLHCFIQGSDVKQTDKQGKRPIDVAQSADIRDFLKNATNEIIKLKREEVIKRRGAATYLHLEEMTGGYSSK